MIVINGEKQAGVLYSVLTATSSGLISMIRAIAQAVLWISGIVAAFFVAKDEPNFPLLQMTVGLILLILVSLAIWWFTNPKGPQK
ncbi:hypothetical protein DK867_18375 [Ochrobactrum sp. POC9]|uniref:hypothetical protein n=1 Tax=unclassified Ochrobactrum TaxID=239106 RepID=UPI000D708926|nr:hypothetical protein [Ochrobactrum sp. POC9]MCH4541536.1 hypothetical protein [Ochrobactrum sp. A-1]PWU71606.1 hypothetical protein DK867_18375 [Ochrobactrum sp. POC9]